MKKVPIIITIVISVIFMTSCATGPEEGNNMIYSYSQELFQGSGLMGYISADAPQPESGYGAGIGFYVAVYPILPEPIDNFQIGLASTWIVPDNSDNKTVPLCPPGTHARDNWDERGPTYGSVFQTIEGGLGMWGSTQFRAGYKPPKFQIVGVPDCYTGNYLISPGWSNKTTASDDDKMGIAQLSNHFIIPPDGFTFQDNPSGELFGYSWMTLPLMDKKEGPPPTGDQHWTLFLALDNFKGPVAFVIPESWSKISKDYTFDYGRGLDAREGKSGGGAQEFNTVPYFEATDENGITYSKVPDFIYPVDENGRTVLMQDIRYYSDKALAADILEWRKGGSECSGRFKTSEDACYMAEVKVSPINFHQTSERKNLSGIDKVVETAVFDTYTFGLQWKNSPLSPNGEFPRYYKDIGEERVVVSASEVPPQMRSLSFKPAVNKNNYSSPQTGSWGTPGPEAGPYYAYLADGSKVTYYWYRFIDQPSLQQYRDVWSEASREEFQSFIEKMHSNFTIDKEYMPAPRDGKALVAIDPALIVTPPDGLENGYVPIVTAQEIAK
ncbi:MAG TPA: hypothetical protein DEQ09_03555 [Bacteroidales bacterium]|nr:hypothetical protein [Bacteroidales bacterium]